MAAATCLRRGRGDGYQVRPLFRPEARHGVTFSLRITRGRCPGLRHRQITGAALRPSRVFLLHVGTQDGGGSGGGGA